MDSVAAMVPRQTRREPTDRPLADSASRLFAAWRKLLGVLVARTKRLGARIGVAARSGTAGLSESGKEFVSAAPRIARTGTALDVAPKAAVAVGLAMTLTGALIGALIQPSRGPLYTAAMTAVSVMWVVARLVVMRLANTEGSTIRKDTIPGAWAAGTIPQLVAVTPALRTFAWCLGAILTWRALRASESSNRDALRLTAWGYGIEVAGFFLVIVARSADVAVRMFLGA